MDKEARKELVADRRSLTSKSPSAATSMATSARGSGASGKVTSTSAFNHYKSNAGTPLRMDFSDIDTSNVRPSDFPQVDDLISGEKSGGFAIDSRLAITTSGDQSLVLGNITLRLQGSLSLDESSYSFSGTLKSFDDKYDFNRSTHRGVLGEILTRADASQEGTPFWIEIRGSKSIEESGSR